MKSVKSQVTKAMKHHGVKGKVEITHIGFNNYRVMVNSAYFSIFNTDP